MAKKTPLKDSKKELSQEEINKIREDSIKFYEEQLPLLRMQTEYEECKTRIEIAKIQRQEILYKKKLADQQRAMEGSHLKT